MTPKPISIVHIGKYFSPFAGGIENFMGALLPTLARSGNDVAAIVHDHHFALRGKIRTLPLNLVESQTSQANNKTVRVYIAPSWGSVVYAPVSPQFPLWIKKAIRVERPDILHLHLPNTSAFWALYLSEARGIPWVIHWHADVVSSILDRRLKMAYPLYRPFEQRLLKRARSVIATSPTYLSTSPSLRPWRDKCRVIPLAIDSSDIPEISKGERAESERLWGDAAFRILSVGRLTYYKGHEYLIKAMRGLPFARALIVGDGERRRILEKIISNLNLGDRVVMTGRLPAGILHALMSSCDCFCLPSIERTEAFGLALLEAMACAKPTIASDIPGSGVGWVIKDGETGRIVPPANPDALAEVFRSLSADRARAARMGRNGYERYQDKFRMEVVGNEIQRLYETILKA